MAKQPIYSKDEDLLRVPLDQEVLVAIPADEEEEQTDKQPEKEVSDKVSVEDDAVKALNDQIEALKVSNKEAEKRLADEQRRARQAETAARNLAQEAVQFRTVAERSHHENLKSALNAAQSDQETHKKDYMNFLEAGDFANAAEAQAKMSRAAARIVDAEKSLAAFEVEREAEIKNPQRQTALEPAAPASDADILSGIDKNPNWLPKEKEYLKAHPELLTDAQKNAELGIAYNRAMSKNISRGTPEYFAFLDEFMGFKKAETRDDTDEIPANGAPVRRENAGGRAAVKPGQVKLTPEQREIVRNMGISEIGYAKNHLKLQAEKAANPEKYNQSR